MSPARIPWVWDFCLLLCLFFKDVSVDVFLVLLGLPCCVQASPGCGEQGLLPRASQYGGLSCCTAESRACALPRLQCVDLVVLAPWLKGRGSGIVAHGLSCTMACEIFLEQGSNRFPLH